MTSTDAQLFWTRIAPNFVENLIMRLPFPATLLLLASASPALAQCSYAPLDQVRTADGLTERLASLQELQLASLKQFTTYLEGRVQAREVPEGVLLNVQAIYTESQLRATSTPNHARESWSN